MIIAKLAGWEHPKVSEMPEERRAVFIENWPGVKALVAEKSRFKEREFEISSYEYGTRQRLTMEEIVALEEAGFKLELEAVDGTMLTKMQSRADKYGEVTGLEVKSGQVVQIAVPDVGLLQIQEVDWMEDACTQELQSRLDDGWRILAVCPPNAQRRPDYILGRTRTAQ